MTPERWISLAYHEQKKALVEAVCREEEWDWADASTWEAFFESSSEADCVLRHFVDVQRLKMFFGNKEIDDFDNDMGMDSAQFRNYTKRLLDFLDFNLFNNEESEEVLLLDAIGSVFVTKKSYYISCLDEEGEHVCLRLTQNIYTDGREDELIGPHADTEMHDFIDELGEWLEVNGEVVNEKSFQSRLIDSIADIEEKVDEATRKAIEEEASRELRDAFDGEFTLPEFITDEEDENRGLGDMISE